jgi:hypothetical protein
MKKGRFLWLFHLLQANNKNAFPSGEIAPFAC